MTNLTNGQLTMIHEIERIASNATREIVQGIKDASRHSDDAVALIKLCRRTIEELSVRGYDPVPASVLGVMRKIDAFLGNDPE